MGTQLNQREEIFFLKFVTDVERPQSVVGGQTKPTVIGMIICTLVSVNVLNRIRYLLIPV
jgi:hypothetical protein